MVKQRLRPLPEMIAPAPRRGKAHGTRENQEDKVVQAGKYNCVCPGVSLTNLSTSKHKCNCFTPGPKLAQAKPS